MKTQKRNDKNKNRVSKKHPHLCMGMLVLTAMLAVVIAVQMVPGGSEDTSAATTPDYTIYLDSPASTSGVTWDGTSTLKFDSGSNTLVYKITQNNSAQQSMNIIFQNNVATTVIISGINIAGNIELQGNATVTMLLADSNTVAGSVLVPTGTTIIIDSASNPGKNSGSLKVTSSTSGFNAGIGGIGSATGNGETSGDITINGGTVTALGGKYAAGIGGGASGGNGKGGDGGTITINGGTVEAIGGGYVEGENAAGYAAGIGGGGSYNGAGGAGGNITINGGTVTARGTSWGTGIGGGASDGNGNGGNGGNITITGGNVTALGGGGPGIGGGWSVSKNGGNGGTITITGGTVYAAGATYSAGIGGSGSMLGAGGAGGTIIITGGAVTAVGGDLTNKKLAANGDLTYLATYGGAGGIGGGYGSFGYGKGAGAILTIDIGADVKAYSMANWSGGSKAPAIHAESISGTGYLVNASFNSVLSKTSAVRMDVYANGDVDPTKTLSLPSRYRDFAYTADSQRIDYVYAYLSPTDVNCVIINGGADDGSKMMNTVNDKTITPVKLTPAFSYSVTLDPMPVNGKIEWSTNNVDWRSFPGNGRSFMEHVSVLYLHAVEDAGYTFCCWKGDVETKNINPYFFSKRENITISAVFALGGGTGGVIDEDHLSEHEYYITATADAGSSISPEGTAVVKHGNNITFTFTAKPGYRITAVYVDGVAISSEDLASGEYTFFNVVCNNTINVVSGKANNSGNGNVTGGGNNDGNGDSGEWAVLNLVCAILAVFTGIIAVIAGRDRFRKDDEEKRSKTALILRVLTLIIGIISVIIFFLTEDWNLPVTPTDGWTLIMFILFLVTLILTMVSFRLDMGAKGKDEA